MVLRMPDFKLHRSLLQTLKRFTTQSGCEIKFDHDFASVISACAGVSRARQGGTWITPEMVQAYTDLHRAGLAHSVETWIEGEMVGGLYCVALGRAVFGESMFSRSSDASKVALAHLATQLRRWNFGMIDCQMNTPHLASLGAKEIPRAEFIHNLQELIHYPDISPKWQFDNEFVA